MVKIEGTGAHPLYVSAARNFVSTPMPEPYLRSVCARPTTLAAMVPSLVDMEPGMIGASEDARLRRLDNVLWKLSLWTSRGRVPYGTSLEAPVRLRKWPNLSRLMTVPQSLRIAALWIRQPTGLLDTAKKLGVPYRYVFAFFSACQSFGLVEQLKAEERKPSSVAAPPPPAAVTQEKRGLFGSLLKKLGIG